MKIILLAAFLLQLLGTAPCCAQNELKERLKHFENTGLTLFAEGKIDKKTKKHVLGNLEDYAVHIAPSLDSLIAFTTLEKAVKEATFERNIEPYLNARTSQEKVVRIDFSDDEEMIYESFLMTFRWENAIAAIGLYEDFIVNNYKDLVPFRSVLVVLSYIRETYIYVTNKSGKTINNAVNEKLNEAFKTYNFVDWRIFAKQPDVMLIWLTAIYAWNFNSNDSN